MKLKFESCPRHTHSRRDYIDNPRRFFISPSTGVTVSTPDSESGNPSSNLGWISAFAFFTRPRNRPFCSGADVGDRPTQKISSFVASVILCVDVSAAEALGSFGAYGARRSAASRATRLDFTARAPLVIVAADRHDQ